jgi:hypothetical protein
MGRGIHESKAEESYAQNIRGLFLVYKYASLRKAHTQDWYTGPL